MNPFAIGSVIEAVGKVADDLLTSDEERAAAERQAYTAETERLAGQVEINKIEAGNQSLFVAGWRPAVGWCGVLAMAYQFVAYPFLIWGWRALQAAGHVPVELQPPPMLETDALWVILTGILGLGTLRSYDKKQVLTS